jgi:medium-chain acyl-[acyl-carrier-protein] hydrolase
MLGERGAGAAAGRAPSDGRGPGWVGWPRLRGPEAQLRLFCLPFAGGGAAPYRLWSRHLPPAIECCPILLPGREERLAEPPVRRLGTMLDAVLDAIAAHLDDMPYAVFGHSFGAVAGFELVRLIRRRGLPMPCHLFVSGRRATFLPGSGTTLHDKPDAALIERMRVLGGTPQAVLDSPELMALLLPAMRADFEMLETHRHAPEAPLPLPLTALGGTDDPGVPEPELAAWRSEAGAGFDMRLFPGGHFFLLAEREAVCRLVADSLAPHLRPAAAA